MTAFTPTQPAKARLGSASTSSVAVLQARIEVGNPFQILGDKLVVENVQNGGETAVSQLGQLVDPEHLHVGLGMALAGEPVFDFHHLHVFEADAGVDVAFDDGLGDVHAAAYGGVVCGRHVVVAGQLVDLDLSESGDVADTLALEGVEVGGDVAVFG